jgi:NAD(P)H-dependent flavin oxidoreductase YrpB (nitropropane dioxygenase family)
MIPNPAADEVEALVGRARVLAAGGPIGVGFLVPFVSHDAVEVAGQVADVVEFFYGDPDRNLVVLAEQHGATVGWQTGTAREAAAAEEVGCDYVVVQGVEAGGHVRGTHPLDHVLAVALRLVRVPLVAAGGIGTPERAAELLSLGAAGARVGTRFVVAEESAAHPEYVDALIDAKAEDTVVTETFGRGWEHAPHRVLRRAVTAAENLQDDMVATVGKRAIQAFAPVPPTIETHGNIAAMAQYAGLSVDHVTRRQSALQIMEELTADLL